MTAPNDEHLTLTYDANGNTTAVTPPLHGPESFAFTPVDLVTHVVPPSIGGSTDTQISYDLDRGLQHVTHGDGVAVDLTHDATTGQLTTITYPQDTVSSTYDAAGRIASIATTGGVTVSYAFDGPLLTDTTWSGAVVGAVHRTYDDAFRVTGRTIDGGNGQAFAYDADGLLTQAGAMTIARDVHNGRPTGTTLDTVSDTRQFDAVGQVASYAATANGTGVFAATYTRDLLGRVVAKSETIAGVTTSFAYAYDVVGRLVSVVRNGTDVASYAYDANGNRLIGPGVATPATYDAQDRLIQYGDVDLA